MQAVVEETRQEALKEVNQALDYLNPLGLASPGLSISSVSSSTGNLIAATSDAASNVAPSKEALSSVILPLLSPFPFPFPLFPPFHFPFPLLPFFSPVSSSFYSLPLALLIVSSLPLSPSIISLYPSSSSSSTALRRFPFPLPFLREKGEERYSPFSYLQMILPSLP